MRVQVEHAQRTADGCEETDGDSILERSDIIMEELIDKARTYLDHGGKDIGVFKFVKLVADDLISLRKSRGSGGIRYIQNLLRNEFAHKHASLWALINEPLSYRIRNFRVKGGYHRFTDRLAEEIDAENTVHLDTPITEIHRDASGVILRSKHGETMHAKTSIVTASIGVLKAKMIKFVPGLSAEWYEALDHMHMGNGAKVSYGYDQAPWDFGETCLRSEGKGHLWWTGQNGHATITGYIGGKKFKTRESLEEATIDDLCSMFGERAREHAFCEMTRWDKDRWTQGTYSVWMRGEEMHWPQILDRIIDQKIKLAGEALAEKNRGTVHGALESGVRAGHIIGKILTGKEIRELVPTPPHQLSSRPPAARAS
jgi:hypothetical protein